MAVSLRKPNKVDLSKPPLEPLHVREITPEHILEEHTPFKEISITPVHTAAEEIPCEESQSDSVSMIAGDVDDFLRYDEKRFHIPRWVIVLISVLVFIGVAAFAVVGISELVKLVEAAPVPETPAPSESADSVAAFGIVFDTTKQMFEYLTSNPLLLGMLGFSFVVCAIGMIKRLFDNIER